MKLGSLFTGYRGLDMAAEQFFDAETVWWSDIDPGAIKINAHHWPDQPNLGDITKINWADVEPVDILTGGWPCQPFSLAGKRKGAADERALWPFVAGAVRALRPRHVVLENVAAIATAGELARACADLAALGYVGSWRCLRAADVGAPHGRARIFISATDSERSRWERAEESVGARTAGGQWANSYDGRRVVGGRGDAATDTDSVRRQRTRGTRGWRPGPADRSVTPTDAARNGWDEGWPEPTRLVGGPDAAERGDAPADTNRDGQQSLGWLGPVRRDVDGRRGADESRFDNERETPSRNGQTPERVMGYLDHDAAPQAGPGQVLRDVREVDDPQVLRTQQDAGGHGKVPESSLLLAELREHQEGSDERRASLAGSEAQGLGVQRVWVNERPARPSQGQEPGEQQPEQPANSLLILPSEAPLARGSGQEDSLCRSPEASPAAVRGVRSIPPSPMGEASDLLARVQGGPAEPADDRALCGCGAWGQYGAAIHRWELVLNRKAPAPTELSAKGNHRLSPRAVEFMMGLPAGHVTDVPGLSRNEQLKALGNGVVPQQAYAALTMMADRSEAAA